MAIQFQDSIHVNNGSLVATNFIAVKGNSNPDISEFNNPASTSVNLGTYLDQYAFIDLSSSASGGGWIDFSKADGTDYSGRIRYQNYTDEFQIFTSGRLTATIESNGNASGSWGHAKIYMSNRWGGGGTHYPTIGSEDGSAGSLIMLDNPHVPWSTENPGHSSYDGRAGLRLERPDKASWWDVGLAGDFFHVYRNGSGELFRVSANGNIGIGRVASANESLSINSEDGFWTLATYQGGNLIGGIHTNSERFTIRDNRGESILLDNPVEMSGSLTVNGSISATGYNSVNWDTAHGWGDHASAGYQPSGTYADGTTYQTYGTGNNGWLMPDYNNNASNFMRMYYDDGSREFRMYSYHGSAGEAKIALYDGGSFNTLSSTNIAEFKTAYSWGNHEGLYDAVGAADVVNTRIDEEIIPLIDTKADASHEHQYIRTVLSTQEADDAMPSTGYALQHFLGRGPSNNDGHILGMTWSGTSIYGAQIWVDTDPNNLMAFRSRSNAGVWTRWNNLWHDGNLLNVSQLTNDAGYINGDSIARFSYGTTDSTYSRFTHVRGGVSLNNPSGTGGAIRINLPVQNYNTNTMMSMTIKVYEYSTGKSFTLFCGGYNYTNGVWYNAFATLLGDNQRGDVPVKFGQDGTRNVIWIGNPDWSWSYPNVFITDFQSGHTQNANWNDEWEIVFDEEPAENVTAQETAHQQINTGNIGNYGYLTSYTETDTLASVAGRGNVSTTAIAIEDSDSSDHWPFRVNTNGSNNSGFWTTNEDIRLLLRNNSGSIKVDLRPDGTSYFYNTLQASSTFGASGTATFDGVVNLNSGVNFDGVNGQNFTVNTDGDRIIWDFQRNGTRRMSFYHKADQETFNFAFQSGSNLQINGNRILTTSDSSGFLKSGQDDSFSGNLTSGESKWIKFYHPTQTDSNDGKIGAGVFGSGLNIVGSQTTAGTGRQVRVWGDLITSTGEGYATESYATAAADAVNTRIDEEVFPQIDTKVSKSGDQVTGTLSVGGSAAYDSTNLALDVQGHMGIWGSNKLYFKITGDNYNTWSTSQYANGSQHKFNAQSFSFTNEGYSSSVFMNINSSGVGMSRNLVLGNEVYGDRNAYSAWGARLFFNGSNTDAQSNYYIGTNGEDYGGNYSKLDLRWHTGIRMGAQAGYGGIRFYDNEDLNTRIMSIGETDSNIRIDNNLWIGGAGGWITDLLNAKETAGAADAVNTRIDEEVLPLIDTKADASHTHDYLPLSGGTITGDLSIANSRALNLFSEGTDAFVNIDARDNGEGARLHKYNRNAANTSYLPYYENWYDGNSYHSIGIEADKWRFSDSVVINQNLQVGDGMWVNGNNQAVYNNYNENLRLPPAGNDVSVIAFRATGEGGVPSSSILGYSNRHETRIDGTWRQRIYAGSTEINNDLKVYGSYTEVGNGIGSVSNDGSWNARLNVAGSSHARLDVKSVSDGIITSMFSHTGHGTGKVGTYSNHGLGLMVNGGEKVGINTSGHMYPNSDRTQTLGLEESRWQIVYCEILDSAGQHEKNLQNPEGEKSVGEYKTGTVLVWKNGKNLPCTEPADHMRMGIAVNGISSPLIQGAEPVLVTGEVNEGDYLVTSSVEGHAKAITPQFMRQHGLYDCVIGKALESGKGESHLIKTWINI